MSVGKLLVVAGVMLVAVGLLWMLGERVGLGLGRLPGDIVIRGERSTFYFPITTCILLSLVLTLVLWLMRGR